MSDDSAAPGRQSRTPKCSRCRNHGLLVPVRGHSKHCDWKLCACPKCTLVTERRKIMAAYKQLRKAPRSKANTPEEKGGGAAPSGQASPGHGNPAIPSPIIASECIPSLVNYERETTRMYLGCPPLYHYPAFPIGLSPPPFRNATPPQPPIPIASMRPYQPLGWRMEQDGGGDLHSQGYYPQFSPFMPSRYLPGLHYMPSHVPISANMRAEPSRSMPASSSAEDQSCVIVMERSEMSNSERHYK